jgi:hypothetical protein
MRYYFILILLLFTIPTGSFSRQAAIIRGTVIDAATSAPLVAANIRLAGTARGTITNGQGKFVLPVDSTGQAFILSYLGYDPETVQVARSMTAPLVCRLTPSPIRIPEVIVLAEDPAVEIIRQAIAHKRIWMDKLKNYSFEAFTRQVLRRDTAIASITESYTTGYMKTGDTLREVVRQKRQTANIPMAENPAAVRRIINFNEDKINLFSIRANNGSRRMIFTGPTAPDALDNYDYKLLKTHYMHGIEVYEIQMAAKSRFQPLFNGTISIASGTFAVMGVDIVPNNLSGIPFVSDFHLRFKQEFSLYDSIFWMPSNIHTSGTIQLGVVGISFPAIGIDLLSSLSDYRINGDIPDTILRKPTLSVDSAAVKFDSSYWKSNERIPLTTEEQTAYNSLDSTQTLQKQFEPKGPLATLTGKSAGGLLGLLDLHFNRTQGLYLGGSHTFHLPGQAATIDASAGYGLGDNRPYYDFGAAMPVPEINFLTLRGSFYHRLQNRPDGNFYGALPISISALFDKNDYRNYFLSHGWNLSLTLRAARAVTFTTAFTAARDYSLATSTDFSIFFPSKKYRENPPVQEGSLRAVELSFHAGEKPEPIDIVSRNSLDMTIEHSSHGLAESDFNFTRFDVEFNRSISTMIPEMLFPPTLRLRIAAGGVIDGTLPPQRRNSLDVRLGVYGPFGVLRGASVGEFEGNRFITISVEHNFRSIPFSLLGVSSVTGANTELLLHGTAAQIWRDDIPLLPHWYGEAGFGIGRIFDFLRADITYRITPPRAFFMTVGISTLF